MRIFPAKNNFRLWIVRGLRGRSFAGSIAGSVKTLLLFQISLHPYQQCRAQPGNFSFFAFGPRSDFSLVKSFAYFSFFFFRMNKKKYSRGYKLFGILIVQMRVYRAFAGFIAFGRKQAGGDFPAGNLFVASRLQVSAEHCSFCLFNVLGFARLRLVCSPITLLSPGYGLS